jgi:putative hydrolase of HD superfamily
VELQPCAGPLPYREMDNPTQDAGATARLAAQIDFIREVDALKGILRRSYLFDEDRRENSAEHSWHVALMALVLAEHADEPVDRERVVKMLLVHDIVEIDAGDVAVYDVEARKAKAVEEVRAADRLFGLLPADVGTELRVLWDEYELQESADARFAKAIDRLMPLLHNALGGGKTWRELGVSIEQVREINQPIAHASTSLWKFVDAALTKVESSGVLARPARDESEG